MELHVQTRLVFWGPFMSFCLLLYECKKLTGYKFPVYSTKFCPGNQTEWNERSSAINCSERNGYLCFPNENFTQLVEFCHTLPFIWIQEGKCYHPYINNEMFSLLISACYESSDHCRYACYLHLDFGMNHPRKHLNGEINKIT